MDERGSHFPYSISSYQASWEDEKVNVVITIPIKLTRTATKMMMIISHYSIFTCGTPEQT